MSYAPIDATISAWASRHGLVLVTSEALTNSELRGIYLSSEGGECCQVWVAPPHGEAIQVHAADVETYSESWHQEWQATPSNLDATLEGALQFAKDWLVRDDARLNRV